MCRRSIGCGLEIEWVSRRHLQGRSQWGDRVHSQVLDTKYRNSRTGRFQKGTIEGCKGVSDMAEKCGVARFREISEQILPYFKRNSIN